MIKKNVTQVFDVGISSNQGVLYTVLHFYLHFMWANTMDIFIERFHVTVEQRHYLNRLYECNQAERHEAAEKGEH